ncbi:MAG: glycine betaine/L-proline ABC transporter ATP-binding protein, partial [Chloroflexi bacterium]|nr:glycine betaine/L-proline ABC transporter ATP-binding protein [Chloroflexota bacterium]
MPIIEVKHLYKIFGNRTEEVLELLNRGVTKEKIYKKTRNTVALKDITLSIEPGETFVVMGLSGSGKSTLVRCLNRLIEPTMGEIWIDGQDVLKFGDEELMALRRFKLSMVFQRFGLLPHRNVLENVAYGLEIRGVESEEREQRARQWLSTVGLEGWENSHIQHLSGGMQQRVGLARALCTDPEILLMDEPFSALDPLIRREMQNELMDLQGRLKKTIVFITHDLDEALRLGDRIAILKDGCLVQLGSPEEILREPADDYVADFTRDVNRSRIITARTAMIDPYTVVYNRTGP